MTRAELWPELTLADWSDAREAVHMWTQIVGKVRLALEPMQNHWWQVPLYLTARGLTTSVMHAGAFDIDVEFDFSEHRLHIRTSDGRARQVALEPRSVADFYAEVMDALRSLGVAVEILARPVEVADATPFAENTAKRGYDGAAAHRFFVALSSAHRVLSEFRGGFTGKASPVHFFWGAFDLAVSRFSGRTAPGTRAAPSTAPTG